MGDFSGQWLGKSIGEPNGRVVADIEERDGRETVFACLFPLGGQLPATAGRFDLEETSDEYTVTGQISPFLPGNGMVIGDAELAKHFPGITHSRTAEFNILHSSDNEINVSWTTEGGTFGKVILTRANPGALSQIPAVDAVQSWEDFRREVAEFQFGDNVFRGQRAPYPLQTSFHRTNRKILYEYLREDVPALHRSLTGATNHIFDLERPQQFGAFLNLAQHHGFPTPLLDWSYSPFVAAWFAFREVIDRNEDEKDDEFIRVFRLNKKIFSKLPQFQTLTFAPPHLSILEALAIENTRAVPQQGLLTLTNIHDIEGHLLELEKETGESFLVAYDLPKTDARRALNELAMMGITRSTMFPSIESICLDARGRMF